MSGVEGAGSGPSEHAVDDGDARLTPRPDAPGSPGPSGEAPPPTPRPDGRGIHRIPIRLAVSRRGHSAPLGVTRDLSLRGVFIETSAPLPVGTVVPLALELEPGAPPLVLEAEVMRVDDLGMGLAFTLGDPSATRRLRRWIVDRTSVIGTQRQVEQLHDRGRGVAPIVDRQRVVSLIEELRAARAPVLVIPVARLVREDARIEAVAPGELHLATRDASLLTGGDDVFALAQIGYVAYSFALRIRRVEPRRAGSLVVVDLPERVVYSERRARDRQPAPPGTTIRWPAPWDPARLIAYPVLERNAHGLSFRADEDGCLLAPGAPLPGAALALRDAGDTALPGAEVRNITRVVEPDGSAWLRVGVAFGGARDLRPIEIGRAHEAGGAFGWLKRMLGKARTVLAYGLHKGRARLAGDGGSTERVTIHGGPHRLVGLLDRTRGDERLRCPLVIVVPGFGGRKEQMSFFAGTLVDGFERQHQDVAVLRFDGSNNIGESGRDAAADDATPARHYTISGLVDDILAVLAWARHNPLIDPTHLVLVGSSMASIGVRHVLTRSDAADVGLWVSYMGAPDAIDVIRLVSGNIDLHAYWQRGQRLGIVSLNGLLTDGDRFWADLQRLDIGDLAAAERELAHIRADVVWLYGRHDAYMDPRRVHLVMSAPPPPGARRELIEVDGGHLPRTGEEAVAQFVRLTRRIWHHVHHAPMEPFTPSVGRLAARAEEEWRHVRRARPGDRGAWWKSYLLDPDGLGFDILEHAPPYRALMDRQADLIVDGPADAPHDALPVLDLGAGTGNLARRLLARGVAKVILTDLVPEALASATVKLVAAGVPAERFETHVLDVDGTPLSAVRRFLAGDLASPRALAERVPGIHRPTLERLLELRSDAVFSAMRGFEVDLPALARAHRLGPPELELLADLGLLARVARGDLAPDVAAPRLLRIPRAALSQPRALPFADGSVAAVAMSWLVSYLEHPDDLLAEALRVLVPGGRLVVSSLVPDYDSSRIWVEMSQRFQTMPDDQVPPGLTRDTLTASARHFVDHAAELFRLAEEGLYRFYDAPGLLSLVRRRGFVDARAEPAFGDPPQAVIVTCRRP
ncbi:MAG: methyltransferase domain-containing protein [Deltaproteobacteria bacterium]|nr:methyltransferase domain-containing protein [Deltaproteobacteria bacterium]